MIIIYEFKKQLTAEKEIKGGRLLESMARELKKEEDSGKGGRVETNRCFRAGINTFLYSGEVHYK